MRSPGLKLDRVFRFVTLFLNGLSYRLTQKIALPNTNTRHFLHKIRIARNELVLDIGSGHNPFIRSNILMDKYVSENIGHRGRALMKFDNRCSVVADIENIPFKNDSIDFVHCGMVFEHLIDPSRALNEMQRVGKRGYILCPTIFSELVHGGYAKQSELLNEFPGMKDLHHGYGMEEGHKWFIIPNGDEIIMLPKNKQYFPVYLLYGNLLKLRQEFDGKWFRSHLPNHMHNQFFWDETKRLRTRILEDLDPELYKGIEYFSLEETTQTLENRIKSPTKENALESFARNIIHSLFYNTVDIRHRMEKILICPVCSADIKLEDKNAVCTGGHRFPRIGEVLILLTEAKL